jgi:hypothetical protein
MRLVGGHVRTTGRPGPRPEPGVSPEGIIGSMEDLKARLADAEAKLSHVKEYL